MSTLTIIEPNAASNAETEAGIFRLSDGLIQEVSRETQTDASPVSLGILLVEDDPLVCELTRLTMERAGYRVFAAQTAEEAVDLWKRYGWCIDLLLSDVFLPSQVTGNDLAELFLKQKPGLKVLLTSGFGSEVIPPQLSENMDTAFLQKPFDVTTVIQAVHQTLAQREQPEMIMRDIARAMV
jgi:DNA-binding NtrC family response regulator